ncbi:LPS O-antigen length regulator [Buttiauxella warmboldiae]|uniref:LPS O-antigen length regulator n=1 Tax=Buttiauxella warmboldiae TaxID=82993 RepID=A0A3N5DFA9_9ENTR|nr:LPS O-antigen length regulator Wzz(fepE) [Buttiauxella warmboldiae]RPH27248.1 LPS O-antigen length regulator [Buttiauxella warmboldiae]
MSSIEMKPNQLENTSPYPLMATQHEEIDLLGLLSTLYAAKKQIVAITLLFALCGLAASFLLPQKWTSEAVVTPPENANIIELRRAIVNMTVLGVETNLDAISLYNLFLKKFGSQELREKFLATSPYVQTLLTSRHVDNSELYRAIVGVSQKFKAVDNSDPKKSDDTGYTSWTLSFTAPDAEDAQQVLQSYVEFIAGEVKKDVITNIKNAVELKVAFEKEKLALDRVNLENQHKVKLERLGYSLQVANAAGLAAPVYSSGQAVKDDPDYSVSLGANGLAEKLKIEQSIKDVAQLNPAIQNREHTLRVLAAINPGDINFQPYQFQMQPSLPLKKEGPGKALIIVLAALVGLMVAAGVVLVRSALSSRMNIEAM